MGYSYKINELIHHLKKDREIEQEQVSQVSQVSHYLRLFKFMQQSFETPEFNIALVL